MDNKQLSVIRGRIEVIERIPYRFTYAPATPSLGFFAQVFAPIFLALSGNSGLAVSLEWQNRYVNGVYDKLDDTTRPSRKKEEEALKKRADHVYVLNLTISGVSYRAVLSGLCFVVGDEVEAVVDGNGSLLAVARVDQTAIVLSGACSYGFAYLIKNLFWAVKFLFSFSMVLILIIGVVMNELQWRGWAFFGGFVATISVGLGILFLFVCCFANRSEFIPARLTSRVFKALGRPDLSKQGFEVAATLAEKDGRKRAGDEGTVLYFWPQEKTPSA